MKIRLRRHEWRTGEYRYGRLRIWQAAGYPYWVAVDWDLPEGSRVVLRGPTLSGLRRELARKFPGGAP